MQITVISLKIYLSEIDKIVSGELLCTVAAFGFLIRSVCIIESNVVLEYKY